MKTIKVIAVFTVVCFLVAMGVIFSGTVNMGADRPHWPATRKLIEIQREQSIAAHAKGIETPALDDPRLIAEGAEHYAPMCSGCHLAPGMEDTEIRKGLYPRPPNLADARHASGQGDAVRAAARQFWIIKHGIKMTAMPAWGTTHDDQSIWALVAFVRKLPDLSAGQYKTMTSAAAGQSHDDGGHDHSSPQATPEQPATEETDHAHGHGETSDAKQVETDVHHHGPENGHTHDNEETAHSHTH